MALAPALHGSWRFLRQPAAAVDHDVRQTASSWQNHCFSSSNEKRAVAAGRSKMTRRRHDGASAAAESKTAYACSDASSIRDVADSRADVQQDALAMTFALAGKACSSFAAAASAF